MYKIRGVLLAILAAAGFGVIPMFSIILKQSLDDFSLLFYRFLISTIILSALLLYRKENFKITKRQLIRLVILGGIYAISSITMLKAYEYLPSGIAISIYFLYPVFVSSIMILFFKEKKSWKVFFAVLCSVTGVAFLSLDNEKGFSFVGLSLIVITIACYTYYIISVGKSSLSQLSSLKLLFYMCFFCTIIFLFIRLCSGGLQTITSGKEIVNLVSVAIISTVIANIMLVSAVKYIGSTLTAILGSVEPVVAMFVGVMMFGEKFTIKIFFGMLLIFIAVMLVIYSKKTKRQ